MIEYDEKTHTGVSDVIKPTRVIETYRDPAFLFETAYYIMNTCVTMVETVSSVGRGRPAGSSEKITTTIIAVSLSVIKASIQQQYRTACVAAVGDGGSPTLVRKVRDGRGAERAVVAVVSWRMLNCDSGGGPDVFSTESALLHGEGRESCP